MTEYCERSGIFNSVLSGEIDYMLISLAGKLALVLRMIWYFITFRRTVFAKKVLNEYVGDIDQYDEIACLCDSGFVTGLCALLGNEKKVSYFDDGLGDYYERHRWKSPYLRSVSVYLQSIVLAKMGYACNGRFYFEPTKYSYKYSAITEKMLYRNYKEMKDIDFSVTDMELYNSIIERTYPSLKDIKWDEFDVVFFTTDLDVFSPDNYKIYGSMYADHISKAYGGKTVLLKRHPKDSIRYSFRNDISVYEIDSDIPAELILPYISGKKIVFSYFSSMIIFMYPYGYSFDIMHSDKLYEENLKSSKAVVYYGSGADMKKFCDRFSEGKYKIVEI